MLLLWLNRMLESSASKHCRRTRALQATHISLLPLTMGDAIVAESVVRLSVQRAAHVSQVPHQTRIETSAFVVE